MTEEMGAAMTGRMIAEPKPSPWGEGGSPEGLTDEGHTAVGEGIGVDGLRTSNREIATAALQPRNDRKVEPRDDRKDERCAKTFPLGGRWQPGWADG